MNYAHRTACIADGAILGDNVTVGAFAVIEAGAEIGSGCRIGAHAVIHTSVRMGSNNRIHPHAVLGGDPQDVSFGGEDTRLRIGDDNVFREFVTVHRATSLERPTRIGSTCYLMANAHVAHDCQLGDHVTLTNLATLAGHVQIGERAMLGGLVPVHQFVRIGSLAMVGGNTTVRKDVLPFSLVAGEPARHYRLNSVGLRRAGVTADRVRALQAAFRALRGGRRDLSGVPDGPEIALLRAWLTAPSRRGLTGFAGADGRVDRADGRVDLSAG
ncbi:MAG: acyl-ACP--UDP-N-acetylglucosamine O-acyltransferase [Gammaproteobacteria bacterium]